MNPCGTTIPSCCTSSPFKRVINLAREALHWIPHDPQSLICILKSLHRMTTPHLKARASRKLSLPLSASSSTSHEMVSGLDLAAVTVGSRRKFCKRRTSCSIAK